MAKAKRKKKILWALFLLSAFCLLVFILGNGHWLKRKKYPLVYEEHIREYAFLYEVDPFMTASIIFTESRFNPTAVSFKDARGLMQILPSTGEWVAEKIGLPNYSDDQLFEPEVNIQIGCWYLTYLNSQFPDNRELVLAAYNGGIGNVNKWLSNKEYSSDGKHLDYIPFMETRNYIEKVLDTYYIYKEIYPSLSLEDD